MLFDVLICLALFLTFFIWVFELISAIESSVSCIFCAWFRDTSVLLTLECENTIHISFSTHSKRNPNYLSDFFDLDLLKL